MITDHDAATPATSDEEDRFKDIRASKPWLQAIKDAEKYYQVYNEKCDRIDELYADLEKMSAGTGEREFQIFWANLEVLKPSIYSRPPVPVVTGRFKDRKPLIRHASELLERVMHTSFDMEDIHVSMKHVRDDLATNARGVLWLRYENDGNGKEKVAYDHVDRKDFVCQQARKWREMGWVARRSYLDRQQMAARFEETNPQWRKAAFKDDKEEAEDYAGAKKAAVWELWSRDKNVVVWVTEGVDQVLDITEPFLQLEEFYPCPRPAFGTMERGTLKPVPDFVYYRDQVEEINELTARISALSEALRMKGFYAAGAEDLSDAIEKVIKSADNEAILVPVSNFAALGQADLKNSIVWLPVQEVAQTIEGLVQLRKQLIEDVYEITGLSDIMRGNTDANETLGAQQLKSQYGATRIKDRQEELIRIARDASRIAGEIMAENFAPETLVAMSQYEEIRSQQAVQQELAQIQQEFAAAKSNPQLQTVMQENPEQVQQAIDQAQARIEELKQEITLEQVFEFLRDQRMRPFVLDIQTDSTIQPDEDSNKQRTTEFLGALSTALTQLAPMVQQQPQSAQFASEVLKFAVAPFRAGRELEGAIDEFADQMKEVAAQPQPNPEVQKMEAEMQFKQQQAQIDLQIKEKELQIKSAEGEAKAAFEAEKLELERQKMELEKARLAMEGEKTDREFEQRDKDRRSADNEKLIDKGMPPDYSFNDDREQFQGILQRLEASEQAQAELLTMLGQGQQAMQASLEQLSAVIMTPKRIVYDETGEPVGVEPVLQ